MGNLNSSNYSKMKFTAIYGCGAVVQAKTRRDTNSKPYSFAVLISNHVTGMLVMATGTVVSFPNSTRAPGKTERGTCMRLAFVA